MISCILLAAGSSERFGSPKALADLHSKSVISQLQDTLLQSACDKIIIVLGAFAESIVPSIFIHSKIEIVYNKDHNFGQTSSMQAGWRHTDGSTQGVMFLPVDCPWVMSSSIDRIIQAFQQTKADILIPTYQDKRGHPPVFHQRLRSKALALSPDHGLNSLFKEHPPQTIAINDIGIVQSFNTPEEFESIKEGNLKSGRK